MQDNLKDILSSLNNEVDQETLLLYLQGKLSEEKRHEIEMLLIENEFASEAADGLAEIKDQQQVSYMVDMLNRDLKVKTERKRKRRDKLKPQDQSLLYLTIVIILILIVISYMVVTRFVFKK